MSAPTIGLNPLTGIGVAVEQAGGADVTPGESVTVKPANNVSPTYQGTITVDGTTPSATLPATVAMVPDAGTVSLATSSGSSAGNVTASVNQGALTNVSLPAGNTLVSDGNSIPLSKVDNTGLLAMVKTHVASDTFQNVALPANYGVVQDQQDSLSCEQFDNTGSFAVIGRVANNSVSVQLANATTRIVVNELPVAITSVTGVASGFSGLLAISGGALTGVTLPADAAFVQGDVAMTLPVTGTYTSKITAQVSADGVLTGFVLS